MSENNEKSVPKSCNCSTGKHGGNYYTELIRIITGLFVGVLALMTFLLTVGFQRPHADFAWALYATIIILPLNLVAYVAAHIFAPKCSPQSVESTEENTQKDKDSSARARKRRKIIHIIQQVLFIAAVVAITWLALSTAHFFFNVQAAPAAATPQ
jgi:hypothetical protein